MKLYRNVTEIRKKETLGRRLSLVGLGVLFVGLLASFVPTWYPPEVVVENQVAAFFQQNWSWISFAALPMGFIFASFGSYFINRFAARRWPGNKSVARPDEVLERSMKGFDDKYAYFVWSLPAHHVLVGPSGLFVFALRSDRGKAVVQGDRWREPFSLGRLFTVFAREGVGNPALELEEQVRKLRALLAKASSENGDGDALQQVPIEPVALFLNPEMELKVDAPSIPVMRADQLKEYVRRRGKEVKLPVSTVREVTDYLSANAVHQPE